MNSYLPTVTITADPVINLPTESLHKGLTQRGTESSGTKQG